MGVVRMWATSAGSQQPTVSFAEFKRHHSQVGPHSMCSESATVAAMLSRGQDGVAAREPGVREAMQDVGIGLVEMGPSVGWRSFPIGEKKD